MTRPLPPLHLGDGAYVCDEDGSVVLRANSHRAEDCTDEVWLDPSAALSLHDWLGHWFAPADSALRATPTSAPAHSPAGDVAGVESPACVSGADGGGAPFSVWQESIGDLGAADVLDVLSPGLRRRLLRVATAARMVELRPSPGTLAELRAASAELTLALAPTPTGALAELRRVEALLLEVHAEISRA